jgi:hypothetical protein
MKYYTISFPGEFGQHVVETWSEQQILKAYYPHWFHKMSEANLHSEISNENCIDDWCVIHWAIETDQFGNKIV